MRVADFFCGGGGFSEGFRQAGFEIVFAVDKWAPAVNTYKGNKPGANVIQDDVIRISNLPDDEFEALVPDSEVIIGSPPCQSFSHSNKSGNADKELGIKLIEAYLKIVARKKFKQGSVLRYWVLENVPAVKDYIKDEYTAADFGLDGDFVLRPKDGASGKYNAKYYGAPTNRERYLCGEFPRPVATKTDNNITTLRQVLDSLGDPLRADNGPITDINYPDFTLEAQQVTDQHYIYELAAFECKTASKCQIINGKMMRLLDFYDEAISIYSIDSVEWRNQQYDTIFCTNVLSAVPYYIERLQILKNAKSVLKDSGVLFISTQYRNSYFNTYNERADIQRFIDGWLIPRTNKKYCFYAPITENALSELCVDAGLQIKKVFKHDGSCFIIAAKPVDGVQW